MATSQVEKWSFTSNKDASQEPSSNAFASLLHDFIKYDNEGDTLPEPDSPLAKYSVGNREHQKESDNRNIKDIYLMRFLPGVAKSISKSEYILTLDENWDDEGSAPTTEDVYNRAIAFVRDYSIEILSSKKTRLSAPKIDLLRDGSIGVNWETSQASFLIIFDITDGRLSHCYGKGKVTGIKYKTSVLNNRIVDDSVATWMKNHLAV